MEEKIIKIGEFILDLLFPPVCLVCRKRINTTENKLFLCVSCLKKVKLNNTAFCPICSRRLPENKKTCHQGCSFVLAAAGFYGDKILDPLIALLKYQKIKQAAVPLGEILTRYLGDLFKNYESSPFGRFPVGGEIKDFLIIPVPLHRQKERQRGFNQTYLLARQLAKNTGLPIANDILKRIKNTASQVELKDKEKREINVKDCFSVEKPELLFQKNVIILDDVFTTGATMKEAVSVIKKAGAKKIIGLVIAKT
jgi:ComF family protein